MDFFCKCLLNLIRIVRLGQFKARQIVSCLQHTWTQASYGTYWFIYKSNARIQKISFHFYVRLHYIATCHVTDVGSNIDLTILIWLRTVISFCVIWSLVVLLVMHTTSSFLYHETISVITKTRTTWTFQFPMINFSHRMFYNTDHWKLSIHCPNLIMYRFSENQNRMVCFNYSSF